MAGIAIFGGTFNPLHIGHYEMLDAICGLDFIDRVLVTPDRIPPHKICDFLADDSSRIEMCRIVCDDFPKAELCLVDFERSGKSYSVDTVKALKEKYPSDDIYFVVGGDMLVTLDEWFNWRELFSLTAFIAFSRSGTINFDENVERLRAIGANIIVINKKVTDVSSTMLRKNLTKNLFPPNVYKFITEKGIYNDKN